jgi:hypothetical protein
MPFSEEYLRRIVRDEVIGDFPPFSLGSIAKTENYIRKIVARLASVSTIIVEADFSSYGSGFASYVEIRISKRDRSDSITLAQNQRVTYETNGLVLYVSRLTPYWFYGGSRWAETYEKGKHTGGGSMFLEPTSQININQAVWQHDSQLIESVLQEFRYSLLVENELTQPAPIDIFIPTILADKPYKVFDCFFYWED